MEEYDKVEHWVYGADDGFEFLERIQKVVDEAKKRTSNRNDFLVYCSFRLSIADVDTFMRMY